MSRSNDPIYDGYVDINNLDGSFGNVEIPV